MTRSSTRTTPRSTSTLLRAALVASVAVVVTACAPTAGSSTIRVAPHTAPSPVSLAERAVEHSATFERASQLSRTSSSRLHQALTEQSAANSRVRVPTRARAVRECWRCGR